MIEFTTRDGNEAQVNRSAAGPFVTEWDDAQGVSIDTDVNGKSITWPLEIVETPVVYVVDEVGPLSTSAAGQPGSGKGGASDPVAELLAASRSLPAYFTGFGTMQDGVQVTRA